MQHMNFDFWTIMNLVFMVVLISAVVKRMIKAVRMNIAVLSIEGVISYNGQTGSKFRWLTNLLFEMAKNSKSKAIIIRINSPGGTVAASQEIYRAIKKVRASGIKVIALMEDMAASGGLYIALAADKIIANAGTITGSIGVIVKGIEYSKILAWLGVKTNVIKSGEFKDIMSSTREMTDAEKQILQDVVKDTYRQFTDCVSKDRNLSEGQVAEFADGRIFNGQQALALGVVDDIGSFDLAVEIAGDLAGIPEGKRCPEYLEKKVSFFEKLSVKNRLNEILPNADSDLSGIPLWLMPK